MTARMESPGPDWMPWPARYSIDFLAGRAMEMARSWLEDAGIILDMCDPDFFAEPKTTVFQMRWPDLLLTVQVDEDADHDGDGFVDKSRCIRVEFQRA